MGANVWRKGHIPGAVAVVALSTALTVFGLRRLRVLDRNEMPPVADRPSVEALRVEIERGQDPDAANVDQRPRPSSLLVIRDLPRPAELSDPESPTARKRLGPFELGTWTIHVRVLQAMVRDDGDIYLICEAQGCRRAMELPDPRDCARAPWLAKLARTFGRLEAELHPSRYPRDVDRDADITGVGFFGTAATGQNGARLLPVLDVRWADR